MRDYESIGCVPTDEPCVKMNEEKYNDFSILECETYIEQLKRHHGKPKCCKLEVKTFPLEFGTYREVVASYKIDDKEGFDEADIFSKGCVKWDAISIQKLKEAKYPLI